MRIRAITVQFTIIAVLLGCSAGVHAQLADTPWPCFRLNQYHDARSLSIGPSTDLVAWTYQIGGAATSSPAIGDDRIYAVSGGHLMAIDLKGALIWSFGTGTSGFSSPAIAADGTVYVASNDGYLYAITSQGTLLWKKSLQGSSDSSPTIGPDGVIYVGSSLMRLFAFYPSGTQKFSYLAGGIISSSTAIASDGTIYFGCEDGKLYALYANGTLKWKFTVSPTYAVKSSPAIGSDGTIYFGSMAGYLYAVRTTGTQIWRYATSGAIVSSPAISADGNIVFGSRDGSLYSLSSSGSQVWKYYVGSYIDSSPAIDSSGTVYFGSYAGDVYALNASGSLLWSKSIGTGVISSPAIGGLGTMYVLSYDGALCAFGGDITPPTTPIVIDDGVYSTLPTTLHASWASSDPDSGISRYEYAIGTSAGAQDLVSFTDAGTAVEVTRTDLALENGADYYFSVRAVNGSGLISSIGISNGIRVDFTPPAAPLVIDDGDWTGVSNQIHIVFGSGDTESGIDHYEYSLGTSAGLTDILGWTNAGTIKEQTITGLDLDHAVSCYASVRAYNHAGLVSEGHSNGIKPDLTKPVVDSISTQSSTSEIKATITASDPESGASEVQYILLTSTDLPASPDWVTVVNGSEFTISGPDWTKTYYIAARAQNGVGAWCDAVFSSAIKQDDTPPSTPIVIDDGIYSTNGTSLHASWSSTDEQSGIREYSYCVGTSAGASNIVAWTTTTNDFASLTGLSLTSGYTYYFTVRAINGAGLASTNGSSDGIKVDLTAPAAPTVYDDGDYTYSQDSLRASWLSSDSESGLAEYSFCIGTAPGQSDITGWSSTGVQSWAAVSGLTLQFGVRYYFTVKARNGAGLWSEPGSSDGIEYKSGVTVWPKFRCNQVNSGCSVISACLTGTMHWSYQTQGYVESSAAIGGDGTVYVGSSDGVLYALNSSGGLRWAYQTGGSIDSSPALNSYGDIYVGSYDGGLYCIGSDGLLKWRYQTGGMIWSSPNIASDGTVVFGCQDGHVYALNSDGTQKWSYNAGATVWSSPAIGLDGSVYFGCGDGRLCALTSAGAFKWSYQTGSAVDSSPAIGDDGVIYVGSGDAWFYAINPDGTKKWRKDIGMVIDSSAAITSDGRVYFGAGVVGGKGVFYALDSSNGDTLWHMSLPGAVRSSPAFAQDGTIYFGCADGTLYALEPNGSVIWQHKVSQSILSSPALGPDGSVVAGSDDGCVYCFRDAAAGDTTPPTTPIVTIDKEALASGMTLNCSWTASDADTGIQYYSYAIGTAPGGTDAVGWTNVGTSTSISVNANLLNSGCTYYVSVTATNWASLTSGTGVSNPFTVLSTAPENSIGYSKQSATGSVINLQGKVVTAVFSDCVFIEEMNRSSGIRCVVTGSSLEPGMIVDITGMIGDRYGERVINSAILTDTKMTCEVKPFYISNDFYTRPGLNPIGLLIRVSGRVMRSGDGYIVVSDGSYVISPRGTSGIEIKTDSSGLPLGTFVAATGVACVELVNSRVAPVIRSVEDLSPVAAIASGDE